MHQVQQNTPSKQFQEAWHAAGLHIQRQGDCGLSWLRATLNPPLVEHLSFRIANQIFFVFIEAAEIDYQSRKDLFSKACIDTNATPCFIPMEKWLGKWRLRQSGWGFIHAHSKKPLNPLDYVSDELIEMTDWELHDFAIQIVCGHIEKEGAVSCKYCLGNSFQV